MSKNLYTLLALLVFTVLFWASASTKKVSTIIPKIPPKFDFSPKTRASIASAGLTVAMIHPNFIGKNAEYLISPFNDMSKSMGNDFEELLSAKGFTMRGPFRSRDEMVYSDKMSSDIAVEIGIDLDLIDQQSIAKTHSSYGSIMQSNIDYSYTVRGNITLSGNLVITVSSPKRSEKIWKKNISLDPSLFDYDGNVVWNSRNPSIADQLKEDGRFYNTMARELEKFYTQAMELAWQQIDVTEMKSVAVEAKKADNRKD
jgi:hypothetical protein